MELLSCNVASVILVTLNLLQTFMDCDEPEVDATECLSSQLENNLQLFQHLRSHLNVKY